MPDVTPATPYAANIRIFELRLMSVLGTVADDNP